MSDHHVNGFSRAKAAGREIIKVVDLGDDFGLKGIRFETAFDSTKEHLCVLLVMDAGKNSSLVGLRVVPTVLAEVARISVADLKAGIAEALNPSPAVESAQ
jgi:hypothetical protein